MGANTNDPLNNFRRFITFWPVLATLVAMIMWVTVLRADTDSNTKEATKLAAKVESQGAEQIKLGKALERLATNQEHAKEAIDEMRGDIKAILRALAPKG